MFQSAFVRAAVSACLCIAVLVGVPIVAHAGSTVTDARGVEVEITDASRIVSVGGSVTEIVYALGQEARLVAVDTTSAYPPAAGALPNVGYMRSLAPEGVLSVEPTLVLAVDGAGPPEALDVLSAASVPVVMVPNEPSLTGVAVKIRFIAQILGVSEHGDELIGALEADAARLAEFTSKLDRRPRTLFILSVRDGAIMAAGADTSADAMITLAGAVNVLGGISGFKPVDGEAIVEAAPEVVVMMSRGDHATSAEELFALPAFAATPAGAQRRLVTMDGLYLLGFGPRTAKAASELAERLAATTASN